MLLFSDLTYFSATILPVEESSQLGLEINWSKTKLQVFDDNTSPPSKVSVWNSLPDSLRDPAVGPDQFRRDLSDTASRLAHCFRVMRYTNRHFTYLLTYLLYLDMMLRLSIPLSTLVPALIQLAAVSTTPVGGSNYHVRA